MRSIPAWISPVIVGSAAVVLGVRWNEIPARFATHWDARGNVNGWSGRDSGVFFPIFMGLGMWIVFEAIGFAVRAKSNKPEVVSRATADLIRLVSIALSMLFAYLAIALPLGPMIEPRVIVFGFLALMVVAILYGALRISRAVEEARSRDPKALEGWHGITYSNPKDDRLWVPKLSGMGWTLNFSHRLAWPVMLLLLGVPIAIAITTILATR